PSFGKNGVVDLYEDFDQPIPKDGTIGSTSPAVVVKDVIVMGNALMGGTAPRTKANTKGFIRGYDVRTGKRLWTFHTIPQPGEVGVTSKQACLYVFDRTNGQRVWPIVERPVHKGDVRGEWYSPTQPFPTRPAAFDRQGVTESDLIDFTPELRAEALEMIKPYK